MIAVVPGSFDPLTMGHLDIIRRAAVMYERVVVGVGQNSTKSYLFAPPERLELAAAACSDLENVEVRGFEGLLVDFCRTVGAQAIVKGARTGTDFDNELLMARMNWALTGVETVILPAAAAWGHVSSTLVRQISLLGGDVTDYVPPQVWHRLQERAPR